MSVVGIGTDILEISRLQNMEAKVREKLALRVLTASEYEKYQSLRFPLPYLAKRWAGKEALAKAIGTGIANGVTFQQISINSMASGKPELTLSGQALTLAQQLGAKNWHISLSDEKEYAVAFVVLSN